MPTCIAPTLRDRKREETHRALARAAYAIVREAGVDAVTAEAVAERAGVSRRTFFNYFPSVEQVLTASIAEFFAAVSVRLEARPADEPVLDGVLAVIDDPLDLDLVERLGVLAAAGQDSAHARALVITEMHAWLDWFEGWLRGRLGPDASDLYVATLASSVMGAGEAAIRTWAADVARGAASPVPRFHDYLARAVGYLRTGLLQAH